MIGTLTVKVRDRGRVVVPVCAEDGTTGREKWTERVGEAEREGVGRGQKGERERKRSRKVEGRKDGKKQLEVEGRRRREESKA